MLNLHRGKKRKASTEKRWKDPLWPHRQDGSVAVGRIGNLARLGPWAVSEIQPNHNAEVQ